jgi:hypothetical protein
MAAALDRTLPPVALRIIEQFGMPITLVYPGGDPVYDPDTGRMVGGEPVEVPTKGVIDRYSDFTTREGGDIQRGDRKLIVAALGLPDAPTTATTVKIGGEVHTVHDVEPTYTGEAVAIYALQVRRS